MNNPGRVSNVLPGHVGPAPQNDIDVRFYWKLLRKRKLLIAGTTLVVAGLVVAWNMWKPPVYQATATVVIEPSTPKILPLQSVVELGNPGMYNNNEYYNTQTRILKSRSLAREVVRRNPDLIHDKRVIPAPDPAATDEDLVEKATTYVMKGVRVVPVRDSRIFAINFNAHDPALATRLANAVSQAYIDQNRAVKLDATRDARRWVAEQLDDARKLLESSETALYAYKRDNNILSVNLEERRNMVSRSLDEFQAALTSARKSRIDLEAHLRALNAMLDGDTANAPSTYVARSESIAALRAAYLEERRKLQALTDRYGEKWPEVQVQAQRTQTTLADLRAEGARLVKSMSAEIRALADAEARYGAELARLTDEALDLNQKEIAYKKLARDATNSEQIYTLLLKRLNESGLQEEDQTNNIRSLDVAQVPNIPIEPKLKQAVILGVSLGILIALALAVVVEILDRTVKSQEDVEATVGLPFLGVIPQVATAAANDLRELHIMNHPTSSAAEFCRVVRTNILFCSPDRPLRTILVTSSQPVEGKTMTVVNIGVVMAQSGQRTLIVDTDMRRPRLHKILGVSNEHGVSRLVVGDGEIEDAVKSTSVPDLYVLPCGPVPPNPAEILQTERFTQLVQHLGMRFDRVIFDSSPVLAVTDAAILSRVTDGTIIVVRAGRTARDQLLRTRNALASVNANLLGCVLNDVDLKNPHYSSYYNYGYISKYHGPPREEAASSRRG
jgi:succinoglycan biosynthesis transport protein ExoP